MVTFGMRCAAVVTRRGGDTAYLFKSPDMVHWEYLHPFYKSNRRWTEADEDCAVPNFFPLGDKHMLLFCSHLQGTQYYLGQYEDDRLYPERYARMSWPRRAPRRRDHSVGWEWASYLL